MDPLEGEKYISLATFRKTGVAVETPIWFAHDDGPYYAFSESKAGKIKRLRNSPRSRVAACGMRGEVHGEWLESETRIVEGAEVVKRINRLMRSKYGWQMVLANFFARLSGRYARRAYLEIRLSEAGAG